MKNFNKGSIQEQVLSYGNKTANLEVLKKICPENTVPSFYPFSNEFIQNYLNEFSSGPDGWQSILAKFQEAQGDEKSEIRPQAAQALEQLRQCIIETFRNHAVDVPEIKEFLNSMNDKHALLMVRSTGEEDSVDVANPGGNESVAAVKPNINDLSIAMGRVVASYFSEKSLKQRLLSPQNDISKPFMPVLVQQMVGEPLYGFEYPGQVIRSGVMYTGMATTCIQIAPGHGELVVESKAACDTYVVSRANNVYAEISKKPARLVPTEKGLAWRKNPKKLQGASISAKVAKELATLGRKIEKHYGMPMDVEFIYDPAQKQLSIVQARPIPAARLKSIIPSSIPPSKIPTLKDEIKAENIRKISAEVITAAGFAAKIITRPEQVLFCNSIEESLDLYLNQKNSPVLAVVVRDMAATTSHPAAQFNAMAIPVLQVEDLALIESWLAEEKVVMMIDPQRNQILNCSKIIQHPENAQEALQSLGYLEEGLFTQPISPTTEQVIVLNEATLMAQFEKIKLMSYEKAHSYTQLLSSIESIEALEPRQSKAKALDELNRIRYLLYRIAKAEQGKLIFFAQVILLCDEIELCIDRLSQLTEDENFLAAREEHLNLTARLKSFISYSGHESIFSNSVLQIYQDKKATKGLSELPELLAQQKAYLAQFLKLNKIALNEESKKTWTALAIHCATNAESTQKLARILIFYKKHHLESDLIHDYLTEASQNNDSATTILNQLYDNYERVKAEFKRLQLEEKGNLIKAWEQRIHEWSNPKQFDNLWRNYEKDIALLITQLRLDASTNPIAQKTILKMVQDLTEVMDKTIKALKGSPEYCSLEDKILLVKRFAMHLEHYHQLMRKWMLTIPEGQYNEWANVVSDKKDYNRREPMLFQIKAKFDVKKDSKDERQLLPSGELSIASAQVGTTASFYRQFVNNDDISLEDLFSLMHQNILASTSFLSKNEKNIAYLPEVLKNLHKELIKKRPYLRFNPNFYLLGLSHSYPLLSMEYNYPLHNHSAKLKVLYEQKSQKLSFHFYIFGRNLGRRMDEIAIYSNWEARLLKIDIKKEAKYNDYSRELNFIWELPLTLLPDRANDLVNALHDYGQMTFDERVSGAQHNFFERHASTCDSELFLQKLADQSNQTLAFVTQVFKDYKGDLSKLEMISKGFQSNMIDRLILRPKVFFLFIQAGIISYEKIVEEKLEFPKLIKTIKAIKKHGNSCEKLLGDLQGLKKKMLSTYTQIDLLNYIRAQVEDEDLNARFSIKEFISEAERAGILDVSLIKTLIIYCKTCGDLALVFTSIKEKAPKIICSLDVFFEIIEYLDPSLIEMALASAIDNFPTLITPKSFLTHISSAKESKKKLVPIFSLMKSYLKEIFKEPESHGDFKMALNFLSAEELAKVYEEFKDDDFLRPLFLNREVPSKEIETIPVELLSNDAKDKPLASLNNYSKKEEVLPILEEVTQTKPDVDDEVLTKSNLLFASLDELKPNSEGLQIPRKDTLALSNYSEQFKELITNLSTKVIAWEESNANPPTKKAYETASTLTKELKTAGDNFFAASPQEFQKAYSTFGKACTSALKKAKGSGIASFGLSLLSVIKAIVGLVLAIPIGLPALALGYKDWYKDKFFSTKDTSPQGELLTIANQIAKDIDKFKKDLKGATLRMAAIRR